jgi:hypothetical protein
MFNLIDDLRIQITTLLNTVRHQESLTRYEIGIGELQRVSDNASLHHQLTYPSSVSDMRKN